MSIIYVLIPIAMLFVICAIAIFFWAVKNGQFDDLEKQSISIFFNDKPSENEIKQNKQKTKNL